MVFCVAKKQFLLVLYRIRLICLGITLSVFGIFLDWGFFGFVLGYGLAPYGYAIPSMLYFLSGKWQKRKALAEEI